MNIFFFILVNFFSLLTAYSQEIPVKGFLFNNTTKEPIPYATVHVANSKIYRDADEKGGFEILAKKTDSLIFSSIGFETLTVSASGLGISDTIHLNQKTVSLQDVRVGKRITATFGTVNDKKDRSCVGGAEANRYEIATLVEIPTSITLYRVSKVFIKGKDFKDENPVRLHIYSVDSNGMPGNELLKKEIIIKKKEDDTKIISIDIKDQNIFIENNSFFVGIQWMTSTKVKVFTGPEIFETFKYNKLLSYRRQMNIKNNKWYGLFRHDMVFFPEGIVPLNDTPINVVASAEIEEFEK